MGTVSQAGGVPFAGLLDIPFVMEYDCTTRGDRNGDGIDLSGSDGQ